MEPASGLRRERLRPSVELADPPVRVQARHPVAALEHPGQSDRIRHDEVVAQDHEDTIGNLAFDESASAGQRTPVESLVERSIHGIAEEHPDIRRQADVLRGPAHEVARVTLATELWEGEHRPDASDSQHAAMTLDRKRKDEHVADEQVAGRADEVYRAWIVPTACAESIIAAYGLAPNESHEGPELDIELPREIGVREDELLDLRRRHDGAHRLQNSLHGMNGMNPKQRCVVILGCPQGSAMSPDRGFQEGHPGFPPV